MDCRSSSRLQVLDVFRGSAIALMVAYHFCFDLAHFGYGASVLEQRE